VKTRAGSFLALALLARATGVAAQGIVADHAATALASIPDAALPPAANLRLLVRHASVGENITAGLDALQSQNAKYDRSRWIFESRGNPGWQEKVDDLVRETAAQAASFDVLTMKFCYIDTDADFAYYRDKMEWLESTYPAKRFVWWTMPITTTGDADRESFNDQVRTYAKANGKVLFDIADVEAYNAAGQKRTDGGYEAMWDEWTSDGGHLSDAGAQRVASAFWWLMARVGGWDPVGVQVTSISPVSGLTTGGTTVTIKGSGFVSGATVTIGSVAATGVVVAGSTSLTAVTGPHATGLADVTVTVPGPRSATLPQGFFYAPPATAADYYTLPPCRLVDTRTSHSPALAASERRGFTITGGSCGVPATAQAVAVNVTVTGATAPGHIRLAPGNGLTESSSINFVAGVNRANNAVVRLATDATGSVSATNGSTGAVHLILDVSGYFE
jgi:hypothetical protein